GAAPPPPPTQLLKKLLCSTTYFWVLEQFKELYEFMGIYPNCLNKHYDNYDIFKFHFYVFSTSRPENATSPKDMIRDAQ
ncbi:MAG: hypothetical protein ACK5HI_19525, partial [Pseudanabaena sp.]